MKNAYVTKRDAPVGYVAVTRPLAAMLYEREYDITICGNNVNSYHVFKGWYLGYTFNKEGRGEADYIDFDRIVNSYVAYSDRELLRYPVFYVRREVVNNMDLSE